MSIKTLSLAGAFAIALTGAAFAQTRAGGGSAEGNMNSPGSVKSESQKMNEERTGSTRTGAPGTTGGPAVSTPGAAAGSNGATGSGAAPSGR